MLDFLGEVRESNVPRPEVRTEKVNWVKFSNVERREEIVG